jgi:cbb3-type cytochrome oxidase subunit 3
MIEITFFTIACIGIAVALMTWFFRSSLRDDNEEIRRVKSERQKEATWIANHAFVPFNKWNLILIAILFISGIFFALVPTNMMLPAERDYSKLAAMGGDADGRLAKSEGFTESGAYNGWAPLITPIDY